MKLKLVLRNLPPDLPPEEWLSSLEGLPYTWYLYHQGRLRYIRLGRCVSHVYVICEVIIPALAPLVSNIFIK